MKETHLLLFGGAKRRHRQLTSSCPCGIHGIENCLDSGLREYSGTSVALDTTHLEKGARL